MEQNNLTDPGGRRGTYIPAIGGIRAISILMVIFYHLKGSGALGKWNIPTPLAIFVDGNFAVNIFFVISGFLITTLLLEEEARFGAISLRDFYLRRIFRIFPAYYFVLLVYFILQLFSVLYFTHQSWLSSIFYYKYFEQGKVDIETIHFWSLSIEEQFYLIWPGVFLLSGKFRVYFAAGIILLVFVCRSLGYFAPANFQLFSSWSFIFQRVDAIMIGCLLAMYKTVISNRLKKFYRWRPAPFILLAFLGCSAYVMKWNLRWHLHLDLLLVPLGGASVISTTTDILIALLLLYSISVRNGWSGFLNSPVMNFIGRLSYSLYLWQQLFLLSDKIGPLGVFPLNLLCTLLAALFSYYIIERPFLRLKSGFERAGGRPPGFADIREQGG
jgi:peptidoglycan/LPS O-acetylase OafA/YrhL